ncbi:hypothetical protein D3C81_1968670 [compost metagenome]
MVMAVRGLPVILTGVLPMNRSKSRPLSVPGWPGPATAHTGGRQRPRPVSREPAARPLTKVRLEGAGGMGWCPVVE